MTFSDKKLNDFMDSLYCPKCGFGRIEFHGYDGSRNRLMCNNYCGFQALFPRYVWSTDEFIKFAGDAIYEAKILCEKKIKG